MAKTIGSLFSVGAHGSIGNVLNFSKKRTGQQGRKFNYPKKDPTGQQLERRILNEYATAMWTGISNADKATWEINARKTDLVLSGYHYFLREALRDPAGVMKMIIFWPLVYNVGTTIPNIPNRNYDGTLANNAPAPAPSRVGFPNSKRRYRYYFEHTAARIEIAGVKNVPFDRLGKYSWINFFKREFVGGNMRIVTHGTDTVSGYFIQVSIGNDLRVFSRRDNKYIKFTTTPIYANLAHTVVTYDGSSGGIPTINAYINGVLQQSVDIFTVPFVSNANVSFNCGSDTTLEDFRGHCSDGVYLNRIVTAAEALILYNFVIAKLQKLKPER